ncbi:hypothetical protein PkP19E3_07320 [Pseudomonas koreensis]|nr:hypothetical protein PkP19E3_07320 [Pseudomonas koreensis]
MAATIAGFTFRNQHKIPCRSCRRLRSFDCKKQHQKIAACGSSYRESSESEKSQAKKSPISLKRSIGLQHSGATSAKGGSMRVEP